MRHIVYAAGLLAAVAVPARAQDVCTQFRPTPAVGSWAEYQTSRDGQALRTRIAVVGQEKRDGKDAIWFESTMETPRGRMISEMLVPSYPFEPGSVIETVVKRGDQPAMKLPAGMMGMMRGGQGQQTPSAPGQGAAGRGGMGRGNGRGMGRGAGASNRLQQCRSLTVVGQESVTVPAGTFKTTHLRSANDSTHVWVSREVPFGMVKSQTGGITAELSGMGNGAKKSITETPTEMPGM
jgi:hypothetical protein